MVTAGFRKASHGGAVKEENKGISNGDEDGCKEEIVHKVENGKTRTHQVDDSAPSPPEKMDLSNGNKVPVMIKMEKSLTETANSKASSSTQKDQDQWLESAKAEMGKVREENQRLRMHFNQIMKDYQALQMKFHDIVQQETQKPTNAHSSSDQQETEEPELVCDLSLGRSSIEPKKDDHKQKTSTKVEEGDDEDHEGLTLGLECKYEVPKITPIEPSPNASLENSSEVIVKEEAGESLSGARKSLKTVRNGGDEVSQQSPMKKARVCVRVRCNTPTLNDGCQWRKYGQKIAKGNPCPRAYYRCTVAPSCPVRKQVQRCVEDMSILITTYEGMHNHPLPISATAMASTTSAAASILMSISSTSEAGTSTPSGITSSATNLHGLNIYLSDNNSKSKQFYLSNPSISTLSSHSTITLDLTSSSSSSSSLYNKISPNFLSTTIPRYSSTNLNFNSLESNQLPVSWGNVLNYGAQTQPYGRNLISPSLNFGKQAQENLCHSFVLKSNPNPPLSQPQLQSDTISAATKAITSDPTFQTALAVALTSIIGTGNAGGGANIGNQIGGANLGQALKLTAEPFPMVTSFPSTTVNGTKCSSSYLNRPPSTTNSQPRSFMFLQSSLPFSTTHNKPTSPSDGRDHMV